MCIRDRCNFEVFPYTVRSTIKNPKTNKLDTIEFKNMDDIWAYIGVLWQEAYNHTKSVKGAFKSVYMQLPFFCCINKFIDESMQKDIERYIYCEDTKTPAFPGSFGQIPAIWMEKHFIIKQSLAILQEIKTDKLKQKRAK